jgi:hypothetical protein
MSCSYKRIPARVIFGAGAVILCALMLMDGGRTLLAQTLAVPDSMPILYKEIPHYAFAAKRARYRVKLPQSALEYRKDGYRLISGDREFVILNQNPACLKRFAGKMLTVSGKTTESVVPWHRLYFLVIDEINGMRYDGKVGPWVMREPTDEEICYWSRNHKLPPATQKFMDYLALPVQATACRFSEGDSPGGAMLTAGVAGGSESASMAEINNRLTGIQRQLTVIEQRAARQPYQGIYSTSSHNWDSTDWSLYMDLQGGG